MEPICPAAHLTFHYILELMPTTGCYTIIGEWREHCLDQCKQAPGDKSSGKPTETNPWIPTSSAHRDLRKAFLLFFTSKATFSHTWAYKQKAKTPSAHFPLCLPCWPLANAELELMSKMAAHARRGRISVLLTWMGDGALEPTTKERGEAKPPLHGKFYS